MGRDDSGLNAAVAGPARVPFESAPCSCLHHAAALPMRCRAADVSNGATRRRRWRMDSGTSSRPAMEA
jgi:hypothetical protein